ncbi:MAG: cobalamin-dependent protein, partial [Sandaracinaceae bacterium]|nr:cobalamin-dependent protein [Sandaracinaceae bacterium]
MRALLIYPRFERYLEAHPELASLPPIAGMWKYRMPPALGLRIVASLTPPDVDWSLLDANVTPIDPDEPADLVALSFFTPQAQSAYEIADAFRARGVTVVMGGMHPSIFPSDARPHCDVLCLGEAEAIWPSVIADAKAGTLAPTYGPLLAPPESWITPRDDLFARSEDYDWRATLVQVARGCPRPCTYCNIPVLQGGPVRWRPVDRVVEQIRALAGREIYVTEDIVVSKLRAARTYATDLFTRLAETPGRLFLSSALIFDLSPALLDRLARAGTRSLYVTFGFDPISRGVY